MGFFDLGVILLQPPANPTSNSCGVHREPLHCSPARHQPCACCSRPPTSSHGGRGGCSTPVTSGGGVQRAQRLGSGAHMAAPSHILPSPLVIPTCRSALPSYPLKDKHRQGLSGAVPPPAPSLWTQPPAAPTRGRSRLRAAGGAPGAGGARVGRGKGGARGPRPGRLRAGGGRRQGRAAAAGGRRWRRRSAAAAARGPARGPPPWPRRRRRPPAERRSRPGPARPGRRPRPRLFPRGPAEPGRRRRWAPSRWPAGEPRGRGQPLPDRGSAPEEGSGRGRGDAPRGKATAGAGLVPTKWVPERCAASPQVLPARSVPGGEQVPVLARPGHQQVIHHLQVLPEGTVCLRSALQVTGRPPALRGTGGGQRVPWAWNPGEPRIRKSRGFLNSKRDEMRC